MEVTGMGDICQRVLPHKVLPALYALVAKHGEKRSLGNLLLEELYSFVGEGWEQENDITLLTLKRSASLS